MISDSTRPVADENERTIMKTVVIGGSGLIGSKLVNTLREHGHEVVAASPSSGVNSLSGEGLAEALKSASVVVDVTNPHSFEAATSLKFFETSTRNLLTYEAAAGVGHHVALSVVGMERLPEYGYFRAKIVQEKLIKGSSIPYSIIRHPRDAVLRVHWQNRRRGHRGQHGSSGTNAHPAHGGRRCRQCGS